MFANAEHNTILLEASALNTSEDYSKSGSNLVVGNSSSAED